MLHFVLEFTSYENTKGLGLRVFFINRVLRLYPALYLCFFATVASIYLSGYLDSQSFTFEQFVGWVAAQLTFFQFYTADFLRGYGVGAPNGSLGTISIELQFYILTPIIYLAFKKSLKYQLCLFLLLVTVNSLNTYFNDWSSILFKLFGVSFAPWLYMFFIGAFLASNNSLQKTILRLNPLVYLGFYLFFYFISIKFGIGTGNEINFLSFIALACLIFKLSHTMPNLSNLLLRRNDISYGIYIYHMPIVNLMIFYSIKETLSSMALALSLSILAGIASWLIVERPALKLKVRALRRYK